ncbi:MAG: hypothetical protein HRT35_21355 [Algicola sp.]|nr:hypothetical protein [Algicola sp.]
MKTLYSLFTNSPTTLRKRYYKRAAAIQSHLKLGTHYQDLGGRQLKCSHELIRFRLGDYRLLFKRSAKGFMPEVLLHRKNLEKFLKRRRGH